MAFSRRFAQSAIMTVALGLTLVLAVGIWRGRVQQEQQKAQFGDRVEAEMKLTDMEYTEMQEGRRLWTIKASEAKYFQDEQKTHLTLVQLTFFLESGETIQLDSEQGSLYAGTKNIELWGMVKARLPRGYELATERAFYGHQQKALSGDAPIRVSGPDLQLEGARWEYSISEHRAVLDGGTRATMVLGPLKTTPK